MAADALIEARSLGKRFGEREAVRDVTLDVRRGEVFGLLGPNGAGKTTTIRMLAGLVAPTSGHARIAGHDVATAPESVRASVGILTETPGLYARLDAGENLALHARLHGVRDRAARIRKYLELLGLWDRRHEPVGAFSKGMRQRSSS